MSSFEKAQTSHGTKTKMSSDLFGLELVFTAVGRDFKRKDDALVALAHWIAVKSNFKSIGLGDDKTVQGTETGSELLPQGWNETETYAIRYIHDGELFILRGVRTDDTLILNLLRTSDLMVSNVALNVEDSVKSITGPLNDILPDHQNLAARFRRELIEPCTKETKQEATTQTSTSASDAFTKPGPPESVVDPLAVPARPRLVDPPGPRGSWDPLREPMSPFGIGRSDLDPFPGGGGMLFNPFGGPSRRNLPRGRLPDARYDPPGPQQPRPGGLLGPDPDNLPPPGYDDIYM